MKRFGNKVLLFTVALSVLTMGASCPSRAARDGLSEGVSEGVSAFISTLVERALNLPAEE